MASTAASEETVNSEAFDESASPATGIKEADGRRTAAQNKSSSRSQGNTIQFVEGYKTLVYNDDTSLMDSLLISDHEGVEARYENKQRKMDKKAIIPNDIHYVNYTTFLQTGIHHYKNADYKKAREIFDQIIGERKNDENALFYGGLSYAGMDQNKIALQYFQNLLKNKSSAFYEEARWNIALIYLKEKNISSSRLLLKEIYDDKGFYSIQAGEKLKELK